MFASIHDPLQNTNTNTNTNTEHEKGRQPNCPCQSIVGEGNHATYYVSIFVDKTRKAPQVYGVTGAQCTGFWAITQLLPPNKPSQKGAE